MSVQPDPDLFLYFIVVVVGVDWLVGTLLSHPDGSECFRKRGKSKGGLKELVALRCYRGRTQTNGVKTADQTPHLLVLTVC